MLNQTSYMIYFFGRADREQGGHRDRRDDDQLCPRGRHRLHQAVHEPRHLHPLQDTLGQAHQAILIHEPVGRGDLAVSITRGASSSLLTVEEPITYYTACHKRGLIHLFFFLRDSVQHIS